MPSINLAELTLETLTDLPLKDLQALQKVLNQAVDERRVSEKQDLLEKMMAMASESGYSLSELLNEKPKKHAKIKYRNPGNAAETWTGRGRKPNWVNDLLESGMSLEDMAI